MPGFLLHARPHTKVSWPVILRPTVAPANFGTLKDAKVLTNLPDGVRAAPRINTRSIASPPVLLSIDGSMVSEPNCRAAAAGRSERTFGTLGIRDSLSGRSGAPRRSHAEHRRLRDDLRELRVGDAREV